VRGDDVMMLRFPLFDPWKRGKEKNMKGINLTTNIIKAAVGLSVLMVCEGCATTQPIRLADIESKGCQAEIETYCKDVTPGQARILACLYAHEDKLPERCLYALYEASGQLDRSLERADAGRR
jgi:hypothetical protein